MKSFLLSLYFLSIFCLSAVSQVKSKVNPKHHKVTGTVFRDNSTTPDRNYRIEQEWIGDSSYIIIKDIKSGAKSRLSKEGGYVSNPVLSPDGKMVAYARMVDSITELRVAGTDSSGSHVLYSEKNVDMVQIHEWSPDNKYIAASVISSRDRSFIMIVSCIANHSTTIIKEQKLQAVNFSFQYNRMSFSPDSRFIAYDLCPESAWHPRDIYVMPVLGGSEIPLVQNAANDLLLSYSPDGHQVLFASDRSGKWDLWVISVDDDGKPVGSAKIVVTNIGNIVNGNDLSFAHMGFMPDGSYYYKKSVASIQLYLATLDKIKNVIKNQKLVSNHSGGGISTQWSPDGKYLAHGWGSGFEYDPFVLGIRSIKDGTERKLVLKELMRHGGHGFEPQWSPDGKFLLATARQRDYRGPGMDSQGLYMIDIATGKATPFILTESICGLDCIMTPLWLDNDKVIFERRVTESLVLRDINTGEEKVIFHSDTAGLIRIWPGSNLAVSRDNKKLAFVLTNWATNVSRLMVLSLEGGTPVELLKVTNGESITCPAWMPNSEEIIYAHNYTSDSFSSDEEKFELCSISSSGGLPKNLGLHMNDMGIAGLSIHPDGKHIAFTTVKLSFLEVWQIKDFLPKPKIETGKGKIKQ